MEITYSSPDTYPVTKSITVDVGTVELGAGTTVLDRVRDFLAASVGTDEHADITAISDPFLKDLAVLVIQHATVLATMEAISRGAFSSTDKEPQYAGGVVSAGNRIYTPQEAAGHALESIKRFS